ncbi:unnamed protein product, partial [Nesidiocoris tenuis]
MLGWVHGGLPGSVPGALPGVVPGMVPGVLPAPMAPPATQTVPPFKPLGGGGGNASPPKAADPMATVPPFSALPASIVRIPVINKVPAAPPSTPGGFSKMSTQVANRRTQ